MNVQLTLPHHAGRAAAPPADVGSTLLSWKPAGVVSENRLKAERMISDSAADSESGSAVDSQRKYTATD